MADKRLEIEIVAQDRASRPIKNLQSTVIRFVGAVSASIAALGALAFPIDAARRFDRILRDIQKTTGFVNEDIKILSGELLNLSKRVDTSADDLGRIAAAAGQLGLGEAGGQAIVTFTESIARAATTLDLTAEQAATNFAKIGTIFDIPIEQTERLISTVNELSNTTTATADQLLDVIKRVGTVAGDFEDAGALAAQAIQLGLSPETAGTSLVKIFSNFESKADQFAEEFGITVGDFLGKGAIERWQFYLDELNKLTEDEAARVINRLSGSGRIFALVDKQVQDAANGFEIFNQAQRNARQAFEDGTSAIREYENIAQSLDVQLGILSNNFAAVATQIGLNIVPGLIDATQRLAQFLQTEQAQQFFREIGAGIQGAVEALVSFVQAVAGIGTGPFAALFGVAEIFLWIKAIQFALGIFEGFVVRILSGFLRIRNSTAGLQNFTSAIASNVPVIRAFTAAVRDAASSSTTLGPAVASSAVGIKEATAAFAGYTSAINTAIVQNSRLSSSAATASQALARQVGAATSSAIIPAGAAGIAPAQARVEALQRQVVLQRQSVALAADRAKIAEEEIKRSLNNVKVIKNIQSLNQENAAKNAAFDREAIRANTQQARTSFATLQTQRQILATAQARLPVLETQLALQRGVLATRQQILLLERASTGATAVQAAAGSVNALATGATAASAVIPRLTRAFRGVSSAVGVLVTGIRGIIGLLGGPLTVAVIAITVFWDELVEAWRFLTGTIKDEDQRLTQAVEQQAARRQAIINRQIADFARFGAAVRQGLEIETAVNIVSGEESLAELENQVGRTSRSLTQYQDVIEATGTRVAELERAQVETVAALQRTEEEARRLALSGQDFSAQIREVRNLSNQFNDLEAQIKAAEAQSNELERGVNALGQSLASGITTDILDIARDQASLATFQEQVAEFEDQLKRLQELEVGQKISPDIDEEGVQKVRDQLASVVGADLVPEDATIAQINNIANVFEARLISEIEKANNGAERFAREIGEGVAALDPTQDAVLRQLQLTRLSARQLDNLVEQLDANEDLVNSELGRTAFLRENADAILSQKFAYDLVNDSLKETQEQLEDNRKAAQGIFDNTIKESKALTRSIEDVGQALDQVLEFRDRDRQLSQNIDQITESIETRTERIAELEAAVEDSTDAYANNKRRAEISELRALNSLDKSVQRGAEREQAQNEFNRFLADVPGLLSAAQAAADAGETARFQAIKDQIDTGLQDSGDILNELAGLQDADGRFLFREDEIRSLEFALNSAAKVYQDAIPGLNQDLLDTSKAQEQQVADAIKQLAIQNAQVIKDYEELLKAFPEFVKNIDVARKAWEEANAPLIAAISDFGTSIQGSLIAGTGLPADFEQQLGAVGEQSADIAAQIAARDSQFNQAVDALVAGADLSAWISKIDDATADGVDAGIIQAVEDGIPTFSAAIEDATETGLANALASIQTQLAAGLGVAGEGNTEAQQQADAERLGRRAADIAAALLERQTEIGRTAEPDETTLEATRQAITEGGRAAGEEIGNQLLPAATTWGQQAGAAILETVSSASPGTGGTPGFATGGGVRGPGTGTSDSILARVSNGEYVSDAKTVRNLGGFGFFEFLRKAAGGPSSVLRSFSKGLPSFAQGGPVFGNQGSMATVNLTLPGVGTFPLVGETSTVGDMTRAIKRETLRRGKKSR